MAGSFNIWVSELSFILHTWTFPHFFLLDLVKCTPRDALNALTFDTSEIKHPTP